MNEARIAIVGGGVAGLYAAHRLEQSGVRDFVLFEARARLGGRIASLHGAGTADRVQIDRFDLGPTWYWPSLQPDLDRCIHSLGLEVFDQYETGDSLFERAPGESPSRVSGGMGGSESKRLVGGMEALVDALRLSVDPSRVLTESSVREVRLGDGHVELDVDRLLLRTEVWRSEHVLLALPPRLADATVRFSPSLPGAVSRQWRDTATWMAPHAKYVAVYDRAFWRERGLSGMARSAVGPMVEVHDASMPGGSAALFGFLGVPASVRSRVPDETLRIHARAQLARLFGPDAAQPRTDCIKDWAADPFTATPADSTRDAHHGAAPPAIIESGPWAKRLAGIASEWSANFSGYLAGAIEAAETGVDRLKLTTG